MTFVSKSLKRSDKYLVSEVVPLIMAESWSWGSQIVVKKILFSLVSSLKLPKGIIGEILRVAAYTENINYLN